LQQNWTALLQSLEQIKKIPEEADRPADAGDYAGANKLLDQVKPKLAEFQKKYEELKKKSGMKIVDVTVQAKDWDGAPIKEATGVVRFTVAKTPDVTLQGTFDKSGVVKFAGVSLMPAGVIFVQVTRTDGAVISPSGTGPYEVKGAGMIFTARQGISTGKSGGRSITEAVKNIGVEGTLGKDFKVVQAGLKVAGGILEKLVTEEYTEWNITAGTDALEVKQDR
jgi:hypothetical protein